MTVRLVVRADAATRIGAGHVMRCLALAEGARERGGGAHFVCRAHAGWLGALVEARGFGLTRLEVEDDATWLGGPEKPDAERTAQAAAAFDADWVVVDHYAASDAWERAQERPVLAIDDLLGRTHHSAALLNQNLGATSSDYAGALAPGTLELYGPGFALLRPEFAALRERSLARRDAAAGPPRILVTMGGADEPDSTGWVLGALGDAGLPDGARVTVVLGPSATHLDANRARAAALGPAFEVLAGTDRMGELMLESDLAVGAGGSTSWERCVLGLPSVVVVIADNQEPIAAALDGAGAAARVPLGDDDALRGALDRLVRDEDARQAMTRAAAAVCDGGGVARVLDALSSHGPGRPMSPGEG